MMSNKIISVTVVTMIDPSHYRIRELEGPNFEKFNQLAEQMKSFYGVPSTGARKPPTLVPGSLYVAFDHNEWKRVKYFNTLNTSQGHKVSCVFVDYGLDRQQVPVYQLREIQEEFRKLPFQTKEFILVGVQPKSLMTAPDLKMTWQPSVKWDSSAATFVQNFLQGISTWKVSIVREGSDGRLYGHLLAYNQDRMISICDKLIEMNYAFPAVIDVSCDLPMLQPTRNVTSDSPVNVCTSMAYVPRQSKSGEVEAPSSPFSDVSDSSMLLPGHGRTDQLSSGCTSPSCDIGRGYLSESGRRQVNKFNSSPRSHDITFSDSELKDSSPALREYCQLKALGSTSSVVESSSSDNRLPKKAVGRGAGLMEVMEKKRSPVSNAFSVVHESVKGIACRQEMSPQAGFSRLQLSVEHSHHGTSLDDFSESANVSHYYFGHSDIERRVPDNVLLPLSGSDFSSDCESQSRRPALGRGASLQNVLDKKLNTCKLSVGNTSPVPSLQLSNDSSFSSHSYSQPNAIQKSSPDKHPTVAHPRPCSPQSYVTQLSSSSQQQTLTEAARSSAQSLATRLSPSSQQQVAAQAARSSPKSIVPQLSPSSQYLNASQSSQQQQISPLLMAQKPDVGQVLVTARLPKSARLSSSAKFVTTDSSPKTGNQVVAVSSDVRRPVIALEGVNSASIRNESNMTTAQELYRKPLQPTRTKTGYQEHEDKDYDVFVESEFKINVCTKLKDFPYHDVLLTASGFSNVHKPTHLQMYAWEAIFRGHDVVGVAPPKRGKSLSYLVPIVAMIENRELYRCLPRHGLGPYAIILCSSWYRVERVYDQCIRLTSRRQVSNKLTPLLMYGGSGDSDIQVKFINGCDILVSTPDCLLRMLEKRATDLARLCHFVVEDADVLAEKYKFQMIDIVSQYQLMRNDRVEMTVPQQVLIFAERWSEDLRGLSQQLQEHAVIIIASRHEAMYYGRVRQSPIKCTKENRFQSVLSVLKKENFKKVIIFTCDDTTCENLHQKLRSFVVHHWTAHGLMNERELQSVTDAWHNAKTADTCILLLSDTIVNQTQIKDASVVIHYDLPTAQHAFAGRMWCCRSNYYQRTSGECSSVLLLPDDDPALLFRLANTLIRSGVEVPTEIQNLIDEQRKQRALCAPLCHGMKILGYCREGYRCKHRHSVTSSLDSPKIYQSQLQLPAEGTVKVRVTGVESAVNYYVRMVEHTTSDGIVTSWNEMIKSLMMDLSLYYCNNHNKVVGDNLVEGNMYAWQDDQHVFHRAELRAFLPYAEDDVQIFLVDIGAYKETKTRRLFLLPEKFARLPHQVVEVVICRLKPVDNDVEWTTAANMFVAKMVHDKELEGKIVLCLGGTLWLDPLMQREWLPSIKKAVTTMCIRTLLIENDYAEANAQHLELLYKACDNTGVKLPVSPNTAYRINGQMVTTQTVPIPLQQDFVEVFVSAIESPDHFYVQLTCNKRLLDDLNNDITQYMIGTEINKNIGLKQGLLVVAKHPCDDRWYRGKVQQIEVREGTKQVDVFFVDYGESVLMSCEDIHPMPSHLERTPFQAVECCLVDIECVDQEWDETFDQLVTIGEKVLYAEVRRTVTAQFTGHSRYGIHLHDMSSAEYDIDIQSQLVALGCARLSSFKVAEVFNVQDTLQQKDITTVCKNLVQHQESSDQSSLLDELRSLIYNVCDYGHGRSGLVRLICQTLQYCWHPTVNQLLLELLHILIIGNLSHCEEIGTDDGKEFYWNNLCHMLDQFCSTTQRIRPKPSADLFVRLVTFLKEASNCARCCISFSECGGLRILNQLMIDYGSQDHIVAELLMLINRLVQNVSMDHCLLMNSSYVLPGCIKCLNGAIRLLSSRCNVVIDNSLKVIKLLAFINKYFEQVVKDTCLFSVICSHIENWSNLQHMSEGVELLKKIIMAGCVRKEVVISSELSMILDRLVCKPEVSAVMKQLICDLRDRVEQMMPLPVYSSATTSKSVHKSRPILNKPIVTGRQDVVQRREKPSVRWSQSKNSILLIVEVKDAQERFDMLRTTDTALHFRAVVNCVEYSFNLNLYSNITFHDVQITPACIHIGLHKLKPGLWPQLMNKRSKPPPYITFDVDHSVLTSSEDEESDSESPLKLLTKNVRRKARTPWSANDVSSGGQCTNYIPGEEAFEISGTDNSDDDDVSDIEASYDTALMEDKQLGYYTVS